MNKVSATIRDPTKIQASIGNKDGLSGNIGNVKGAGGTKDYNNLANKPKLNDVTIEGEHEGEYYGLADRAWVETYVTEQTAAYTRFWFGTRSEYNALPSKDPAVCYCIEEGT